jgi:hypothetical protein
MSGAPAGVLQVDCSRGEGQLPERRQLDVTARFLSGWRLTRSRMGRARGVLARRAWRGMLVAAALLSAGVRMNAQEFRLFPASASGPRYFSTFDVGAAGFRIVDLEDSSPWSPAEGSGFGLRTETPPPADAPDAAAGDEPASATSAPVQRCVIIQCVKLTGEPEAPPAKLFTTPVILWTVAGLLVGFADGIDGPIRDGFHSFRFTNEGFFQYGTYGGGSDKASHFVISTIGVDTLYDAYRLNRLTPDEAFWLSWATVTLAGAFVEIGDGLTPYGFSAQDLIADTAGAGIEALIKRNNLGDMLGFRLGRWLQTTIPPAIVDGRPLVGIDYSQEIYTADLKLGGVATRLNASPNIARFFLFSFAFMTKGYGYVPPLETRYQEVGLELGLNFPEILKAVGVTNETWWGDSLLRVANFLRIPFTQVGAYYNLKNQKWYGPGAPYHYYNY